MSAVDMSGKNVSDVADYKEEENVSGTVVLTDDKISAIYLEEYTLYGIVDEISSSKIKFKTSSEVIGTTVSGKSIITNDKDDEFVVTKDGKQIKVEDIKEDDVIFYYQTKTSDGRDDKYVIKVVTDSIEGKVTAKQDGKKVYLDRVKYDTALRFTLDDEVVAYKNASGDICMYTVEEDGESDVAIIKSARKIVGKYNDNYEIVLLFDDGKESDTLTIDLEETYDEWHTEGAYEALAPTSPRTTKDEEALYYIESTAALKPVRGAVVCYEINGNELTILQKDNSKPEYIPATTSDSLLVKTNKSYVTVGGARYYVDKNTTFIKLKNDKTYSVKAEFIDYDSLDGTTAFVSGSYIADIDYDEKYVGTVVFGHGAEIKRSTETNFAYVKSIVDDAKYGDDSAKLVTLIFADGSSDDYYANPDITGSTDLSKIKVGTFADVAVDGEEILGFDLCTTIATDKLVPVSTGKRYAGDASTSEATDDDCVDLLVGKYLSSKDELTLIKADGSLVENLVVSDDCLVLEQDTEKLSTLTVRSISDLDDFDAADDDTTVVTWYVTYTNDDNETEVVFLVYQTVDMTEAHAVSYFTSLDPTAASLAFTAGTKQVIATEVVAGKPGLGNADRAAATVSGQTTIGVNGYTFVANAAKAATDSATYAFALNMD